ncbi:Transcriptional regulators [Rubrobacter radiotolerans]|uniref:Transcriptional regulators n=2 Tax=Rubrobacter radiotolerans TaxID=42256 RepID=A0A023X098_RUBRA|nr:Transcriptional regulators [Rubrobacter radiotolerans]
MSGMGLEDVVENASRRYRTTQSMVVGGLRDAILSGVLVGGQPLRQDEIAEQFGVSRMPVREALRQLEGEGMVSFYPHRGAVVSELSQEEVLEIIEIRVALETMALRKAFPLLGEEELRLAEDVLRSIDEEENLVSRWGELNWRFHATLFSPADRPRLLSIVKAQHTAFERYIRVHLVLSDYENPQREHYELLDTCRRKDLDGALQLLSTHIQNTGKTLLSHLR